MRTSAPLPWFVLPAIISVDGAIVTLWLTKYGALFVNNEWAQFLAAAAVCVVLAIVGARIAR
jgi:hypothetical protein